MVIGLLRVHIHIPDSHSLKDKRSVIKRLQNRLRTSYNCAVSEVDDHDLWQSCVLAIVTVYHQKEQVTALLEKLLREMDTGEDFQLLEHAIEFL